MGQNESSTQMGELLKGVKPTILSKGLNMLAMNLDKIDGKFKDMDEKFKSMDEKLDDILEMIGENKIYYEKQISVIENKFSGKCDVHKTEIENRIKNVEGNQETLDFFKKHPLILKIVAMSILIIISYLLGGSEITVKDLLSWLQK